MLFMKKQTKNKTAQIETEVEHPMARIIILNQNIITKNVQLLSTQHTVCVEIKTIDIVSSYFQCISQQIHS